MAVGSRPHKQPPLTTLLSFPVSSLRIQCFPERAGCGFPPSMSSPCGPAGSDSDLETLWVSLWQSHLQGPTFTKKKQGYLTRAGWAPREALRCLQQQGLRTSLLPPQPASALHAGFWGTPCSLSPNTNLCWACSWPGCLT